MWYLLRKGNIITEKERETQSLPYSFDFKLESHREGSATYFREYLRYMKKWVDENKSDYDIYKDGLKIYTTIDSRMQLHAEEAVSAHMAIFRNFLFRQKNKTPFVGISDKETQRILTNAMKASNRWSV
jgi:penicillin-binding protein 1A